MIYLKVLGITQDGGYPHAGCYSTCCNHAWNDSAKKKSVCSIAIVDDDSKKFWLLDISPDIKEQLNMIGPDFKLAGVFLTHAHIGHYVGLFQLGLEVMNLLNVPVYAMPRMKSFLENNSAISFIIQSKNITPIEIGANDVIDFKDFCVEPFFVPHRNEMSETVAYKVYTKNKSVIYLPDIDSWDKKFDIINLIYANDILFLDGTFYDKKELKKRKISKVPHPSVLDSINFFRNLDIVQKNKIYFTHLNHTNILLNKESSEYLSLISEGYNVADERSIVSL